jgi:hypothetical protein
MSMVYTFVTIWVTNAVILWVANMLFSQNIVLGTMSLNSTAALLLSSAVLAWICTLAIPFFTLWEMKRGKILTPTDWMAGYLVVNAVALWLVSRAAEVFGLGISSWIFVIITAAVLDMVQGMVMMAVGKMMPSSQ